jgi:hypothetical protein
MLLNEIGGRSKRSLPEPASAWKSSKFQGLSGRGERELGMDVWFGVGLAMRASGTAGLGASAERLVNDGLDGAGTAAAFGAAAEAAVDLLGVARKIIRGADSTADIVVTKDVAGTDNHKNASPSVCLPHRYLRPRRDAKGKTAFSSDSKLTPYQTESANRRCRLDSHRRQLQKRRSLSMVACPWRPSSPDCALQNHRFSAIIHCQMWPARSLIIQAKCGTFTPTECLFAVLAQ